jgi:hypothetical protein
MDPLLVLFGGLVAFFVVFSFLLAWHPKRGRELVGELRPWKDHDRMAEIDAHDTDQMLDGIIELRRRAGRREVGDELGDELMRGTWEKPEKD